MTSKISNCSVQIKSIIIIFEQAKQVKQNLLSTQPCPRVAPSLPAAVNIAAATFDDLVFCYVGENDCLCLRSSCCLAVDAKTRGCGMVTDPKRDECCKIGCFCADIGLVKPQTLCSNASQLLCCYDVCSLPCTEDYVPECVCAYCFLQCTPECGCCVEGPPSPALVALKTKTTAAPPQAQEIQRE